MHVNYRLWYLILLTILFGSLVGSAGCSGEKETSPPLTLQGNADALSEKNNMNRDINASIQGNDEKKGAEQENSPPDIMTLKLVPALVYRGTRLTVQVSVTDREGDEVEFLYRWQLNDEDIPYEEESELNTEEFGKGDRLAVFVTPFDGTVEGMERKSNTVVISNSPPQITSSPTPSRPDGMFVYNVLAEDPDGDELQFSLEKSPPGMSIDPLSGLIEWKMPEDGKGMVPVRLVVSDGDASAYQDITFKLSQ